VAPEGIKNIREVFCLSEGTIEDYYPLDIVADVINQDMSPPTTVEASDFDNTKHGVDRLNDFKKVMHDKGAGGASGYLKRYLATTGTKIMKDKGLAVPDELKRIFEKVVEVVHENDTKAPSKPATQNS
jgi:hypothetical protein